MAGTGFAAGLAEGLYPLARRMAEQKLAKQAAHGERERMAEAARLEQANWEKRKEMELQFLDREFDKKREQYVRLKTMAAAGDPWAQSELAKAEAELNEMNARVQLLKSQAGMYERSPRQPAAGSRAAGLNPAQLASKKEEIAQELNGVFLDLDNKGNPLPVPLSPAEKVKRFKLFRSQYRQIYPELGGFIDEVIQNLGTSEAPIDIQPRGERPGLGSFGAKPVLPKLPGGPAPKMPVPRIPVPFPTELPPVPALESPTGGLLEGGATEASAIKPEENIDLQWSRDLSPDSIIDELDLLARKNAGLLKKRYPPGF